MAVSGQQLQRLMDSKLIVGLLILWESSCSVATQIKKIEFKDRNINISKNDIQLRSSFSFPPFPPIKPKIYSRKKDDSSFA